MYQGATPQAPQVHVQMPQALPQTPMMGGALNAAVHRGLDTMEKYTRLKDFGTQQRVELKQHEYDEKMKQEFQQRSQLPWGAEGSFYTAEGKRNEDTISQFVGDWQRRNNEIARPYLRRDNALRGEAERQRSNLDIELGVNKLVMLQELENNKKNFQDNYDLAVKNDDYARATSLIAQAVENGQITGTRGEVMKLSLAQRAARARSAASRAGAPMSFNFGGQEYSGASAVLAAQAAREGVLAQPPSAEEQPNTPQPAAAETQVPQGEGTPPQEENTPGGQDEALPRQAPPLSPASQFFESGDIAGVCKAMPLSEFNAFQDDLAYTLRLAKTELPDGRSSFSCSPFAPECVQRAVARAEQTGELSQNDVKDMVSRITLDVCYEDPSASVADVLKAFDESGVYETLGNGDATVGKLRTQALVEEWRERAQSGTEKMPSKVIERMVEEHLLSTSFGAGREWQEMERIGSRVESDAKQWTYNDSYGKDWNKGYHIYEKYRKRFDPTAKGALTDAEWQANAPAFIKWYKANVYRDLKVSDLKAAKDWYMGRISETLIKRAQVVNGGKAEYQGYANDIRLVSATLESLPPVDLGADALLDSEIKKQGANSERSKDLRVKAAADYERLSAMKADFAANSEKAKKAMDREKKAEEKREQAEEKRQEAIAARKLAVERARPRNREWAWNQKESADGESPACTIPEEDYRELVENLGYDGTQEIYLRVNGGSVQVVGTNKSGRIELNTPAALKVQKKPNKKRGETWKLKGSLGYSYQLRNVR